jgi:DNA-binding NarL/FixJ family response regulator
LGSSTTSHVKEQETAAGEPGAAAGPICVVVVEEAADGERAVRVVARVKPDVVLMDLRLPQASGVEATRRILERLPGTHVLVLTISDAERDVTDAILAGARGYLLKESTLEEIMAGIRSAAVGQSTLSPRIAARVLDRLRALEQSGPRR